MVALTLSPSPIPTRILPSSFPSLKRSRLFFRGHTFVRATTSEEASSGANQYVSESPVAEATPISSSSYGEKYVAEVAVEEQVSPADEPPEQLFELLQNINENIDSGDLVPILLYGSGALVALWVASAVVGAIDSIPLFPKLMEVVGLAYTIWFGSKYLLFKKNREEVAAKIEELKREVLGLDDG